MTYHCPTCGQPATKPNWLIARENGFDGMKHCGIMANLKGKVTPCWGWRELGTPVCDLRCPIWHKFGQMAEQTAKQRRKSK